MQMILTNHILQPFPLQTTSLFGGSSGIPTSSAALGPVGVATVPRNVNIHIHTGMFYLTNVLVRVLQREFNGIQF